MNNNRGIMLLVFGLTAMTVVTASLKGAISYVAVENSGVREATGVSDTGFQLNNSFQPMQNYSGLTPYKAGSRVYDSQYINSAVSFKVTGQDLVSPVNNIEARFAFTAVDADSPSGFRGQNFVFRPTAGSVITSPISFTFRVGSLSASSQLGDINSIDQGAVDVPGVLAATTSGATRLALAARVDNAGPNTVDWVSISGTLSDGSMPDFSSASTGYGLTGIPTSGNPSGGGWSHYLNDGSGSISLIDSAGNPDNGHARATEGGSTDGVGIALIDPFSAREFSFQEVTFTYAPGSAGFTDTTEFRITFDGGVVPEPSSLALLSLSGLLVLRRSRRF